MIERMRKEGYNQARIAECLGRDPGTISREIGPKNDIIPDFLRDALSLIFASFPILRPWTCFQANVLPDHAKCPQGKRKFFSPWTTSGEIS